MYFCKNKLINEPLIILEEFYWIIIFEKSKLLSEKITNYKSKISDKISKLRI